MADNAVPITVDSSIENLQEAMWRMEIQGGGGDGGVFPDRPGEPDCIYYLRTGSCGYGASCRYNHPAYTGQGGQYRGELPERVGQPDCQYFLKTGACKFGSTCKYHHPPDKHDVRPVPLNILGLPMRQDEKACPYYMRTGSCKFGFVCKFNHPPPTTLGAALPVTGPPTYGSLGSSVASPSGMPLIGGFSPWPLARSPFPPNPRTGGLPTYMPYAFSPSQGTMPPQQGWSTYMGTMSRVPSTEFLGTTQISNSPHLTQTASGFVVNLPERPDQPECHYYMKTGNCKYGTSCKYHHPKERNSDAVCTLGPLGLPLRPGQTVCTFYSTYGSCKYGSACKYDHPMMGYYNYSLPATSDRSAYFPNQRNSEVSWTPTEASTSRLRPPVRLMKSEVSNGIHLPDEEEQVDQAQTSLPPQDASSTESPADHTA